MQDQVENLSKTPSSNSLKKSVNTADIEEVEMSSLPFASENSIQKSTSKSTALQKVYDNIEAMKEYAKTLASNAPEKAQIAHNLATALKVQLKTLNLDTITPSKFTQFSNEFNKLLHSKDTIMNERANEGDRVSIDDGLHAHRDAWKPICANIAFALTGVGLLCIIGKAAVTFCSSKPFTLNNALFWARTEREALRDAVEESFNELPAPTI